ncbi:MAG: hypothetical protein E7D27_10060 [Clostridium celatum]|nr:hypothetical protein [Clostridium celatum]
MNKYLDNIRETINRNKKKLELDILGFEYEFKIKDSNNMLMEVTVDSNLGAIIDLDNYYD